MAYIVCFTKSQVVNDSKVDINHFISAIYLLDIDKRNTLAKLTYLDIHKLYKMAEEQEIFKLPNSEDILYDKVVKYLQLKNLF